MRKSRSRLSKFRSLACDRFSALRRWMSGSSHPQVFESLRETSHELVRRRRVKAEQSALRFSAKAPDSDHHVDTGELYPQFPAERSCLRESKWRYGRDAEDIFLRRFHKSERRLEGGAERERDRYTPGLFE